MKRRSFLTGASTLALAQLVSGCNTQQRAFLNVQLLKGSIPAQLLSEFKKTLNQPVALNFDPEEQLQVLFNRLQIWKQQADETKPQAEKKDNRRQLPFSRIGGETVAIANLVTLGDYWLEAAIQEKLIQPLNLPKLKGWQQLPPNWRNIVTRDDKGQRNNSGQVWGAPYRWGTTVIAYNREKLEAQGIEPPRDWSDLWNSKLKGQISLLDQPREVIGLTLKKLGSSYNTRNLNQVPNLKKELLALHQQVKLYSSKYYLQPLVLGDTSVALGWSSEVLPVMQSYREIGAVVPPSGTALWTDVWVQPAGLATQSTSGETDEFASLMQQWIDFCWQPTPAREISLFTPAASPVLLGVSRGQLPKDLQENRLLLPESSVVNKSEFLEPLPEPVGKQYQALWKEIRTSII
jgi:putative spermidine/putrescine transport system substrate-binding protein